MITEDYVSFETAKLLQEKGFDAVCRAFYVTSKECGIELFNAKEPYNYNNSVYPCISAPTLQMAMKWLREVHNLWCDISPEEKNAWFVDVFSLDMEQYIMINNIHNVPTYEQACEVAIKYCLENLI